MLHLNMDDERNVRVDQRPNHLSDVGDTRSRVLTQLVSRA